MNQILLISEVILGQPPLPTSLIPLFIISFLYHTLVLTTVLIRSHTHHQNSNMRIDDNIHRQQQHGYHTQMGPRDDPYPTWPPPRRAAIRSTAKSASFSHRHRRRGMLLIVAVRSLMISAIPAQLLLALWNFQCLPILPNQISHSYLLPIGHSNSYLLLIGQLSF